MQRPMNEPLSHDARSSQFGATTMTDKVPHALASLCALVVLSIAVSLQPAPPLPVWPDQFTSDFWVRVGIYGPNWNSTAKIFYDWTSKTFRADYFKWCLPLFNTPNSFNNYSCSFLATQGNLFFVNFTASKWEDYDCCLFAPGLGAVPPNWMGNMQYNGTTVLRDINCDVWWRSGTADPSNPCYGYWDARDKVHTPVQFFGLSSLGPTTLEYYTFDVGPPQANLTLPNKNCHQECKQPGLMKSTVSKTLLPHFPNCD